MSKDNEALDREALYELALAAYRNWYDEGDYTSAERNNFTAGYEIGYTAGRASMREEQRELIEMLEKAASKAGLYQTHCQCCGSVFMGDDQSTRCDRCSMGCRFIDGEWQRGYLCPVPPTQETEEPK